MNQIFRQFFDKNSFTYTYLIGDLVNKVAVLIDTVHEHAPRELKTIEELEFKVIYLLSTHVHADHITGNALLKEGLQGRAKTVLSKYYDNAYADIKLGENDTLEFGSFKLNFLHTPGHTLGCTCIVDHANRRVFTGDTLLIRGCGRTDFQHGSSEQLYDSVHNKLFKLPHDYTVYPAHDYNGKTASSIYEELKFNPRLTKTKEEFVDIMANLNLAYPKLIDIAVPRNIICGYESLDEMKRYQCLSNK